MDSLKLKDNLYWVGIEDFDMRVFDIIMTTEYGSSFNSYILKGSEATVLFETEKTKFFEDYLREIEQVTSVNDIKYIVMNHTEPDHADGIGELLKLNPEIEVIGTVAAVNNLKQIMNREDFKFRIVKNLETLSLGDITLEFHVLPNLHWPDTMWTYAKEIKTLFPCDSFGSHFATKEVLRSLVTDEEGYWKATKYYFDCILGPFRRPFVVNGLKRLETLDVDMICTGHGPVLDSHIDEIVAKYNEWCEAPVKEKKNVVIPYVTAYGYTGMLAEALAKGLRENGVDVELYDMVEEKDANKVIEAITAADGLLVGSPTIVGEALPPVANLLNGLHAALEKGKPAMAFGSFGWSGEAVPALTAKLTALKYNVQEGIRVKFKPSEADLAAAEECGKNFAELVKAR
ncbi:MAG: FprA family A-type flavoprotein [Solobacterium sp.]|nr:FprA family A-type flavoprotein [Solobacterium sp.]